MELKLKVVDESYKYRLGEQVGFSDAPDGISLIAARRDWAAFQVLIQGNDCFTLSIGDNTAFTPRMHDPLNGEKKQYANVRLNAGVNGLPGMVVEMRLLGMADDDDGIYKADILLHNETVFVEHKGVQPVWVEIAIPENAKPGIYTGSVDVYSHTMFEDEKICRSLPFEITVKNACLPKPEQFRFHLDLWQHLSNISRKHEVTLWSVEHFKLLEGYVESLSRLGQKAITIVASEIPWSGQGCFKYSGYVSDLFEYNMIKVEKNSEGKYSYDFSAIEKYIEICFKYGIDKEIEVFGLTNIWVFEDYGYGNVSPDYPDAIRIRYFDESDGCFKFIRASEEIKLYIKALEKFFIEKGYIDIVRVVADEPSDIDVYRKRLKLLSETAPAFKYKTAINHAGFISEFKDIVEDFVPILPCVCEESDLLNKSRKDIKGRLSWYVCCWPDLPNTFIGSPLLESRLIGILTAFLDFDGFLRWNYTVWPEKPRERISYKFPEWKAGDTNFVYPANDGRPLLSLRYKNLKRGIEDFEFIQLLKDTNPRAAEILEKVWDKLLKSRDIKEFHPSANKRAEDLYSLEYKDYQWAKAYILDNICRY